VLRCLTPSMIERELLLYIIAYNLVSEAASPVPAAVLSHAQINRDYSASTRCCPGRSEALVT
jgi:hypothetical protein